MDISFYTAAVSAAQQQRRLDVHANNIANINTNGFRARRADFSSLMTGPVEGVTEELARGVGARLEATEAVFDVRGLTETGRALDFAIEGQGFFALNDPVTGEFTYSRDGSFTLSELKRMEMVPVTEWHTFLNGIELQPYEVLPEELPEDAVVSYQEVVVGEEEQEVSHWYLSDGMGRFVMSPEGQVVEVQDPEDVSLRTEIRVGVFDFLHYNGIRSMEDNRFQPVEKNGQVGLGTGRAVQGFLEQSNTDLAYELSKVIETQRSFSLLLRMVTTSDEITTSVNGLR